MITRRILGAFLSEAGSQALREGLRYLKEGRVGELVGTASSIRSVVGGTGGDYDVALWSEDGRLSHRCSCPSWRDPCKHQVAVALGLSESYGWALGEMAADDPGSPSPQEGGETHDAEPSRESALNERQAAALHESLKVEIAEPPTLTVRSESGFSYEVTLRGQAGGPHSCTCPDFEANRLHTCKHVERVRLWLHRGARLDDDFSAAASAPRIYLRFGEVIEPRLFGTPTSSADAVKAQEVFDEKGVLRRPLATDDEALLAFLQEMGELVEERALRWVRRRVARRPGLCFRATDAPEKVLPNLLHDPPSHVWEGAQFLATSGRALLADEMGLDKAAQAVLGAALLRSARHPACAVTIVCPAPQRRKWISTIASWLGERASALEGDESVRRKTIARRPAWLITHYGQIPVDHEYHRKHAPDLLIIDAIQRAGNHRLRIARLLGSIDARYVFALAGIPLEDRLEDAYAIGQLVDQRLLPPLWQLERDHFVRDRSGRKIVLCRNVDALRPKLAPALLRRRREDPTSSLPDRLHSTSYFSIPDVVKSSYDEALEELTDLCVEPVFLPGEAGRALELLEVAQRLAGGMLDPQDAAMDPLEDESPCDKISELRVLLEELCLGEGRRVAVFSQWAESTRQTARICDRLSIPVLLLDDDTPPRRLPRLMREFFSEKGPAVLVATDRVLDDLEDSIEVEVVILVDHPWIRPMRRRRQRRLQRPAPHPPPLVVSLITEKTIEEKIVRLARDQPDLLDSAFRGDLEQPIADHIDPQSLRAMLRALIAGDDRSDRYRATVDGETLHRIVSALAPSIPPSHRASLAAVLRAMADALESKE